MKLILKSVVKNGKKSGIRSEPLISLNVRTVKYLRLDTCFALAEIFKFAVAPEEAYDGRSLYERLKEQRDAKDLEFEESRKFKNMIRGLDEDEVDHLADVDNRKIIEERKQKEEEMKELQDYRAKVAELQEMSAEQVPIRTK